MLFKESHLAGAFVIELEKREDHRGYFARTFCESEFGQHGLVQRFVQCNTSWNPKAATLRGMHMQRDPHGEVKLLRCTKGKIVDVIVDMRPDSATYLQHLAIELSPENGMMLYVPIGFAHGYQTLVDDTEVSYMVSEVYTPGFEFILRWNDPKVGIQWPIADPILSEKDAAAPLLP